MHECRPRSVTYSKVLAYSEVRPCKGGAVLRFYIRRELAFGRKGSAGVWRTEWLGEALLGGELGLAAPRSSCALVAGVRFGGEAYG